VPRAPALALVLGAIVSVQVGGALAKTLFDRVGPGGAVWLRLVFAAAVMLAVTRPRRLGRSRTELADLLGYALVLACMNWAFYLALARLPLGVAVTVEFTGPLTVALAGSRRPRDAGWALLAGAGVVLLTGEVGSPALSGIGFALLAGGCWAAYIVLAGRVGRADAGTGSLAIALAIGAVALAPVGIASAGTRLASPPALLGGLAVALLSSVIPYSLEMAALRRIRPATFGVLMSLEPAAAALAGFAVLGEALAPHALVAVAMVTVASAGVTLTG
jgi:inner membrane transporter RhtA